MNSQDSLLTDIKQGQSEIKNEVKSSAKKNKPDINVKDSPNTIIQVNEHGNNVIDQSTNIIGSKPRTFTQKSKDELLKMLSRKSGETITISSMFGDGEGLILANEIKTFLESKGFPVDGVHQDVYNPPVIGQIFNLENLEIIIGLKQ